MFSKEVKASIEECVLCWLATADQQGFPSVSPKEIFCSGGDNKILIANIASPHSVTNILENQKVCVSFVDIFKQKGFQVYGVASYLSKNAESFQDKFEKIATLTQGVYPVAGIICVSATNIKPIIAPSYRLFPDISEQERINSAKKTYGV